MTVICNWLLGWLIYILLAFGFTNRAECDSLCKLCLFDLDVVHILRFHPIPEQLVTLDRFVAVAKTSQKVLLLSQFVCSEYVSMSVLLWGIN
jgi:hypothetical protein